MPDASFPRLKYRGNFSLKRKVDYSGVNLFTEYANGYREDVTIGIKLMEYGLVYSALVEGAMMLNDRGELVSRRQYIEDFVEASILNGNAPFVVADPVTDKDYLCIFKQDSLDFDVSKANVLLSTTGLTLRQVNVQGVNTLNDGSLGLNDNPDQI